MQDCRPLVAGHLEVKTRYNSPMLFATVLWLKGRGQRGKELDSSARGVWVICLVNYNKLCCTEAPSEIGAPAVARTQSERQAKQRVGGETEAQGRDLPKATQQVSGRARDRTHVSLVLGGCSTQWTMLPR